MSALSRRHHGGDRQHHAARGLPAASGHIVTEERRSNHANPKRPPGRGGGACAASAIGVPARGPNSQIQGKLTARKTGWHGEWIQTATRDAPVLHQQTSGGIQRPQPWRRGELFSPTRFSLTGAHSSRGILPQRTVRRAAKRKTLYV